MEDARFQPCLLLQSILQSTTFLLGNVVTLYISFLLFVILLLPVSVHAQGNCPSFKIVSPIENQKQQTSDWCSAAASRVAMSVFVQPPQLKSQCQLMADVLPGTNCCADETGCHPRSGIWPHQIFDNNDYTYKPLEYHTTPPTAPPEWEDIVSEVCDNNRPLVSIISIGGGIKHAVVVEGYYLHSNTTKEVQWFDPQEDLCEDQSTCGAATNPTFYTYDWFFLSGYDHDRDYVEINPPSNTSPPPSPANLRVY